MSAVVLTMYLLTTTCMMRGLALTPFWFVSDLEILRSFQSQIAAIQRDAVWWLHTVVPTISKVGAKDYVHWLVTACP